MLFLIDVGHASFENANETRKNNLQPATVSLQVVIGLYKRKETAALKTKAAVSNRRVDISAVRRLFFFCCRIAALTLYSYKYFPKLFTQCSFRISMYINNFTSYFYNIMLHSSVIICGHILLTKLTHF